MMTPARVLYRHRIFLRNAIRWAGIYVAWVVVWILLASFANLYANGNIGIVLFSFYLLLIIGIGMVTITLTLEPWVSAPLAVKCPQCFGNIIPNEEWICGYCSQINDSQPLVGRCAHCGEAPLSVLCPRDDQVIQLDRKTPPGTNHAKLVGSLTEITESSPIDEILEEKKRLEAEKEVIQAQTARLQALAARKQAEGQLEDGKPESLEASVRQLLEMKLELPDVQKRLEQELKEKYADDADGLKTARINLKAVIQGMLDEGIAN